MRGNVFDSSCFNSMLTGVCLGLHDTIIQGKHVSDLSELIGMNLAYSSWSRAISALLKNDANLVDLIATASCLSETLLVYLNRFGESKYS